MTYVLLVAGLVLLVAGANGLVKGASGLAAAAGVPSLIIGLTVVSMGTSAPELSVSVASALQGRTEMALGNVVGSNILNVLLILGLSAAITPLAVQRQLVRLDVPLMIGASAVVYVLALDARISLGESALLLAGLVAYVVVQVVTGLKGGAGNGDTPAGKALPWYVNLVLLLGGLGLLVLGTDWFVGSAVALARALGMSDLLIGLTIIAGGTSLPEVATSVIAALRGEGDIAVGNVVGSNLFNLLGVLGATGLVATGGIPVSPGALGFDIPVMVAVAMACLPIFFSGMLVARWEGFLFLAYYVAYTAYIVLDAAGHEAAPLVGIVMLEFVAPLTAVTLGILVVPSLRKLRGHASS
jgi:cation:H+ antiporter